ncbi:GntR family transcriptional regulator [Sulfitobacter sp. SH24]|uniref:GntR family transcriptional regulator n=1 Tax=Sulfitobacter sp. SH24 TaxID=3421173 RepID=UPI003F5080DB
MMDNNRTNPDPSDLELEPVRTRMTVADNVHASLRQALILGKFDPGQLLTISALAKRFQTSQMPVRETLRRLAAEGALEMRSNGSAYVPQVTREALDDICQARVSVERLATKLAVERSTEAEIDALARLEDEHAAISGTKDIYDMLEKNRNFHFAIYRAARSPVLLHVVSTLWLRYGPFMRMLSLHLAPRLEDGLHEPFLDGHHAIVEAIRGKQAENAADLMQKDIERTQTLLQQLCD